MHNTNISINLNLLHVKQHFFADFLITDAVSSTYSLSFYQQIALLQWKLRTKMRNHLKMMVHEIEQCFYRLSLHDHLYYLTVSEVSHLVEMLGLVPVEVKHAHKGHKVHILEKMVEMTDH